MLVCGTTNRVKYSSNAPKTVVVIGAGIAGLTVSAWLAKAGFRVIVLEKNPVIGGRMAGFRSNGFTFELGPTWYGSAQVIDDFFTQFGHRSSDFYRLKPLQERYTVFFGDRTQITVPAELGALRTEFSSWEQGSDRSLNRLVAQSTKLNEMLEGSLWRQQLSTPRQWLSPQTGWLYAQLCMRLSPTETLAKYVSRFFTRPQLQAALLAPILATGLTPEQTSALYSAHYFSQLDQAPLYPSGGMVEVPKAVAQVAWELGVQTQINTEVEKILVTEGRVMGVQINGEQLRSDAVVVASDYQQAEQHLLVSGWRTIAEKYWKASVQSQTVFSILLGLKTKIHGLGHHSYYVSMREPQATHISGWIEHPDFYCSIASQTDWQVAPKGGETLRLSVVLDSGLGDTPAQRQKYFNHLIAHFESVTGVMIHDQIVYQRVFSHQHYVAEWGNAQSSALGLLPSPAQMFWCRPPSKSSKVAGLYYVGQTIDPGPGLAQVMAGALRVSQQIMNDVQ